MHRILITTLLSTGIATAEDATPTDAGKPCPLCAAGSSKYAKRVDTYSPPDVAVTDHHGATHRLAELLDREHKPVLLTFSFTSCSTICPVLNATFASVQQELAKEQRPVRLVTISIDPTHDTPEVLARYAKSFNTADNWTFLTGSEADIQAVRKAFNAHTANKGRHAPLVFFRPDDQSKWLRLDGLMSGDQLLAEVRSSGLEQQELPSCNAD